MLNDLRYAFAALLKTPGFTLVAVLTLAFGIGANTALFSVVDAALLKPTAIPQFDRVVRISADHPQAFVSFNQRGFEMPQLMGTASFDAVGAYVTGDLTMAGRAERLRAAAVTPEFYDILRIAPVLGRAFNSEDITSGSFDLALISYELWHSAFNGDRDVLGRTIVLDRRPFVVLGVMPREFDMPQAAEVWVPSYWGHRVVSGGWVFPVVIARLTRGTTPEQAVREIAAAVSRRAAKRTTGFQPRISPLRDTLVGDTRAIILLLATGALIVLLVASTNIASLVLTRVSARQREFAVRRALGASNRDIARQILAETALLAAMAFIVMLPIASWTLDAVRAWVPIRMYGATDIAMDGRAVFAAAMFTLSTALLFSAVPLWSARGPAAVDALRGGAAATADSRWRRFRSGLAIAEIAFALLLLAGAMTVIRTVSTLMAADLGVRADRVLVVGIDWPEDGIRPDQRVPLLERYQEAFRSLPGVESVALTSGVPGATSGPNGAELLIDGLAVPDNRGYVGTETMASPEYFSTMGIDLVAGRAFAASDHFFAPKVAVISESFARRFGLHPKEAVGRRAVLDHRWVDIVGVVRDVRLAGPAGRAEATAYVPFAQRQSSGPLQFVVKANGDPAQLIAAARAAGTRVDPNVPLYDIRTFTDVREAHVRDRRFIMTTLSWFGALSFALAILGLYAIVSYLVQLRTREIGIRMAMGATSGSVRIRVLANGIAHCVAGIVIGAAIAMGLSTALSSQLRDLGQVDLMTLSIVSAAFLGSAALAAWVPARRATLIDPVQALRFD